MSRQVSKKPSRPQTSKSPFKKRSQRSTKQAATKSKPTSTKPKRTTSRTNKPSSKTTKSKGTKNPTSKQPRGQDTAKRSSKNRSKSTRTRATPKAPATARNRAYPPGTYFSEHGGPSTPYRPSKPVAPYAYPTQQAQAGYWPPRRKKSKFKVLKILYKGPKLVYKTMKKTVNLFLDCLVCFEIFDE